MNATSNETSLKARNSSSLYGQVIVLIIYIAVFALGTVGNSLVIYVTGYKMKRTVNSIWFLNLALADFFFTCFLLLTIVSVSWKYDWPFGLTMCKLNTFVSVLNMFASIFLLTTISLDRCVSTWLIVWTQNHRTVFKAMIACCFIWGGAIICSIPFASYRELIPKGNLTLCASNATNEVRKNLAMFRFMMGFFIPFVIIICSYMAIGVKVSRLRREKKFKPFRVILVVILAFFICWLPLHLHQLSFLNGNWSKQSKTVFVSLQPYILILAYMNSCLNPILYVFMCEEFKRKLKQSLLVVLEAAFAEEQLTFLSSRRSISSHHSINHNDTKQNETVGTLLNPLEESVCIDE